MKFFYALPLLLATAAAFTQYGNKAGKTPVVSDSIDERSASLPFLKRPALLDGSLPGE
jgi:hypothetical protein